MELLLSVDILYAKSKTGIIVQAIAHDATYIDHGQLEPSSADAKAKVHFLTVRTLAAWSHIFLAARCT